MLKKINIHQISAALAVFTFISFIIIKSYNNEEIILSDAIVLGLAAGMIPVAIFLIVFPFRQNIEISELQKMGLQITIGGLVLLFIYCKTIFEIFSG